MMALVVVTLSLAHSRHKDYKQLKTRSAPVVVGSAMIVISKLLMGASINASQGSKRRSTEVGKAQALQSPPNPRVPAFKGYATLFTTAPRPSFLILPSSPLATNCL